MHVSTSDKIQCIEGWLTALTQAYANSPNQQLAKIIHYYLERLCSTEGFSYHANHCQYLSMLKFWQWQAN